MLLYVGFDLLQLSSAYVCPGIGPFESLRESFLALCTGSQGQELQFVQVLLYPAFVSALRALLSSFFESKK